MFALKFIILLLLLYSSVLQFVNSHNYSNEDLDFLANLNFDDLPPTIRNRLQKSTRIGGDNTHWCCKNNHDIRVTYTSAIREELRYQLVSTRIRSSSSGCGFLGLGQCNTYDVRYSSKALYLNVTKFIPRTEDCPDHMLICCNNYINVAYQCYSLDKVNEITDALIKLKEQGLLGTGSGLIG